LLLPSMLTTMPQEKRDRTTPDNQQNLDDSRDQKRKIGTGSIIMETFPMEKAITKDDIPIPVTQPFHEGDGQSAHDICTASLEAAPQIETLRSRKSSLDLEVGTSKDTTESQILREEVLLRHKNTTTTTIKDADQQAQEETWTEPERLQPADDSNALTFIKNKKGLYHPVADQRLKNNLLPSVGFLEFANATDFAANVWNTIPVPKFAAVLMGLGGAVALTLVPFAIKDGLLCWANSKMLIQERILLLREAGEVVDEEKGRMRVALQKGLDTRLEVNRKELGNELFDRGSMDLLMGISALLVGIGTLMAIGGANPRVYHASNLLSGYIGNSPSTVWGLCNTAWCVYLFIRARRHLAAARKEIGSQKVMELMRRRIRCIQRHSVLMGTSTLVSGAAGMVTATHWYGYPPLIPCIVAAVFGNWFWRNKLGYDRPLARVGHAKMSKESLIEEIEWVVSMQASLGTLGRSSTASMNVVSEAKDLGAIIELIVRCDLFEELCQRLLVDASFTSMMEITNGSIIIISSADVLTIGDEIAPKVIATATAVIQERGQRQLQQRQRYLLEMLGASVVENQEKAPLEMPQQKDECNG
jgi:hypothetical protein